jgi:hypothetical protein
LELRAGTAHGRQVGSAFTGAQITFSAVPPAGTAWSQADVWWAYRSHPGGPAGGPDQIAGSIAGAPSATCARGSAAAVPCSSRGDFSASPLSAINQTTLPLGGWTAPLSLSVSCDSAPAACPSVAGDSYALLRTWRLRVSLADGSAPAFTTQPALPASHAGADLPVEISATDIGSGVSTAQLVVDGAAVGAPRIVDAAGGRCAKRADGTYEQLVPCSLSLLAAPVALDATGVPNGSHAVAIRIADAAGNITDSATRSVTIDNPPPPVPLSAIPTDNPLRGRGRVHNGNGTADSGTVTAGLRSARKGAAGSRVRMRVAYGRSIRLSGTGSWARTASRSRARCCRCRLAGPALSRGPISCERAPEARTRATSDGAPRA